MCTTCLAESTQGSVVWALQGGTEQQWGGCTEGGWASTGQRLSFSSLVRLLSAALAVSLCGIRYYLIFSRSTPTGSPHPRCRFTPRRTRSLGRFCRNRRPGSPAHTGPGGGTAGGPGALRQPVGGGAPGRAQPAGVGTGQPREARKERVPEAGSGAAGTLRHPRPRALGRARGGGGPA